MKQQQTTTTTTTRSASSSLLSWGDIFRESEGAQRLSQTGRRSFTVADQSSSLSARGLITRNLAMTINQQNRSLNDCQSQGDWTSDGACGYQAAIPAQDASKSRSSGSSDIGTKDKLRLYQIITEALEVVSDDIDFRMDE